MILSQQFEGNFIISNFLSITTKTWAQVAAAQPKAKQNLQPPLECQVARSKRSKCEIMLSTCAVEGNDKETITKMNNQQLTNHLNQVANCDSIIAARKTTKQTIKICCETDDHADKLRNAPWSSYILGLNVIEPSYSIVVHGVSKLDINPEK